MLAGHMRKLVEQMRNDYEINQYFDQFMFEKREIVNNFVRYGEHLDKIIGIVVSNKNVNFNVYGQLVTHLIIWLSQNKIYSGE